MRHLSYYVTSNFYEARAAVCADFQRMFLRAVELIDRPFVDDQKPDAVGFQRRVMMMVSHRREW